METTMKSTLENPSASASVPVARPVLSGILTGQAAGLIMAVVVMLVFAVIYGKSPLYPVQVIGSTFLGESALRGFSLSAVLVGLVLHQAGPSLLWGFIYGLLAKKFETRTSGEALALGLGLGVVSMVGPYLLIPAVMNAFQGVDLWNREVPMFWDWAAHLVFGASFLIYPRIAARIGAKR
jgi:hypothetical protein